MSTTYPNPQVAEVLWTSTMPDIWSSALSALQPRLGKHTFEMWLAPIRMSRVDGTTLHLVAPNRFLQEWFETHYLETVLDEIESQTQTRYQAAVEVSAEQPTAPPVEAAIPEAAPEEPTPAPIVQRPKRAKPPTGLAPRYRFETFITGGSNELAASAAMAVADEPGSRFNPLFLYGGVGLGKTHLLHAVGHHIYQTRPELRIVYLSAERFMNEFVTAVRHNGFDAFRAKYREDCDVLLLDDVQFIAGRDRTMDEFFHVFNALYEAGKQIMCTADRVPADMPGMEERLTSRLNWGLVADIKAPDLETRIAIVSQKAERDRIDIAPDVCMTLATLVRSNVRELEGALLRVAAFASLKNRPITADFVREVLGETAAAAAPPPVSVEAIQKAVASYFSVRVADLKGPRRHRGVSRPRMIAMYLSRELTSSSFPEIGMRFGGKDHSTVINACKRIGALQEDDQDLRHAVTALRTQLLSSGA